MRKDKALLVVVLLLSALTGCTHVTSVYESASFDQREPKIATPVKLEIPNDTLQQVTDAHYLWDTFRVPTGRILAVNARNALGSVFNDIKRHESPEKDVTAIELRLQPGTTSELGTFTFSENSFKTVLQCVVKAADGRALWSKTVESMSSGRRAGEAMLLAATGSMGLVGAGATLGYMMSDHESKSVAHQGEYVDAFTGALQDAANESVAKALREIADALYRDRGQVFTAAVRRREHPVARK